MSLAYHCDADDCDAWTFRPKRHGFLSIKGQGIGGGGLHFCSWDCVLKFSAKFEPSEIMSDTPDEVE